MESPKKSKTCCCNRNLSTRECQVCSGSNQEICGLCGKRVPSVALSNEILVGNPVPDNTCQCFLSIASEIEVPEKAVIKPEQKTELPVIQITDPQNLNLSNSIKEEKSCSEKNSGNLSKKYDVDDSEESKTPELSISSNGYALSLYGQSDRNFTDPMNTTSPSSGDDSKSSSNAEKRKNNALNLRMSKSKTKLEHENGNREHNKRSSNSSPSEEGRIHNRIKREGESSKSEYTMETNNNKNLNQERTIPTMPGKFRFENQNVRFTVARPQLPRPFPYPYPQPYQPCASSVINMPVPIPFHQMYQPYVNPIMNLPVMRTNFPGRFSVVSRPQLGASYHQQPMIEGCIPSFSRHSRTRTQPDSEENHIKKLERVASWLNEIECHPPDDEPADSDWASRSEQPENDQVFSGTSTDERSSTELSEEENRRQRASRRPPRSLKRNKPK